MHWLGGGHRQTRALVLTGEYKVVYVCIVGEYIYMTFVYIIVGEYMHFIVQQASTCERVI